MNKVEEVEIVFREIISVENDELVKTTVYILSTTSDVDGLPLWLGKDLTLTRVKGNIGFVRSLRRAGVLMEKIFKGEIREGIRG